METKICSNSECKYNGQPQPLNNFYKSKVNKDGYDGYCKDCKKKKQQSYYKNNSDAVKNYQKQHAEKNKDIIRERKNKYYEKNKSIILEKQKKYIETNIEKVKEYKHTYYSQNKNYVKSNQKSRILQYALYATYYEKLTNYEECRKDPNDSDLLQVKCTYCNNWFNPINQMCHHRSSYINGKHTSESRFYCSDGCKNACPIFNKKKYIKTYDRGSSREAQPELRKLVLERDNWTCTKCNMNKQDNPDIELHCHHILPINESPVESADVDNCITLCKECHKVIHKVSGCTYNELKCSN